MVVRGLRISVLGVSHQPRDRRPQPRAGVLGDGVLGRLAEVERPGLRRDLLAQTLAVLEDVGPAVAVEVVDGAAGADEEVVLEAQGPQGGADLEVEVGVEAGVGADDGGGRAGGRVGEHADQHQVGVVDPLEGGVGGGGEAGVAEHGDAARGGGEVRVGRPVLVSGGWDERAGRLARGRVGGHLDAVAQTVPVRAHDDDALDAVGEGLVAALLPVRARFRVGVEHARRAVREEMHWSCA